VDDDDVPIAAQVYVQLECIHAQFDGLTKRLDRVLRRVSGVSAVANDGPRFHVE
jgi:hypothetical protein